ncbi:helix-turn-helix transcriptional regulator [Frankia sp. AgB1.9]|uniref:AraC family transcriptional regulator n=1 Tax=unclassified Frankia TaxID=2632575 RepID=UPI001931CD30|nr:MULTISPECIES: helix-turn-helix transcriptional regulator [unclassified Frankia]MBL7488794.1 helix-turn-helix transcriptional regulator [Frankia sp. AgW1.1]MBL7546524.1 helix-turn-helix transcriptional regulator [Frankia sp. AgB1.9]MBL7622177.1 helix-turn-helix transcriptional regulator [Frankia sp. AgB1.8]
MDRLHLAGPTRLRLAAQERVDWHDHAEHQLAYPGSGVLRVTTALGSWVVPPLRAVWLPAELPHAHRAYGPTQMHSLWFGADDDPFGARTPTVVAVSDLLREIIRALTDPAVQDADRADLTRVLLRGLRPVAAPRLHLPQPSDDRLAGIAEALRRDPADPRTLAELGATVGASERTLSRLFRAETGMTFPQWRAQLRLHHGMALLATGEQVTTVALTCGYSTPSSFTAAFHAAFGVTPTRYAQDSRPS